MKIRAIIRSRDGVDSMPTQKSISGRVATVTTAANWQDLIEPDELLLFLDAGEILHGAEHLTTLGEVLPPHEVVLLPHIEDTCRIWKLRLCRSDRLPAALEDFVGPAADPSKLQGLANYRGVLTESIWTTGGTPLPRGAYGISSPPRDEISESRAFTHIVNGNLYERDENFVAAFAEYAQASVIAKNPEAHFGLARLASYDNDPQECVRQTEIGWSVAEEMLDVLPWHLLDREFFPAVYAARAYCDLKRWRDAESAITRARRAWPENRALDDVEVRVRRTLARRPLILKFFTSGRSVPENALILSLHEAFNDAGHSCTIVKRVGAPEIDAPKKRMLILTQSDEALSPQNIRALDGADGVIVGSEWHAERLRQFYPFLPPTKIHVLPFGYTPSLNNRTPPKLDRSITYPTGCSKLEIDIVNDVVERVRYEIENVKCVESEYGTDDFALETSRLWFFPACGTPIIPTELLHAQAVGCVPVVAAEGALSEHVLQGYMYKSPASAEDCRASMAKRIVHLLTHEHERLALAEEGRRRALPYAWPAVIGSWIDLLG